MSLNSHAPKMAPGRGFYEAGRAERSEEPGIHGPCTGIMDSGFAGKSPRPGMTSYF